MSDIKPRPVVVAFAEEMEKKLRENEDKGGWTFEPTGWLFRRLGQEVAELRRAVKRLATTKLNTSPYLHRSDAKVIAHQAEVAREAADVANFAMMIADVSESLMPNPMAEKKP